MALFVTPDPYHQDFGAVSNPSIGCPISRRGAKCRFVGSSLDATHTSPHVRSDLDCAGALDSFSACQEPT
jgi:hypothetical protein